MLINEEFDNWIRELFLWTFEHESITLWFIAMPIVVWIIVGLFVILSWGSVNEDNVSWKRAFVVIGGYVLAPIAYLFVTGYVGHIIFN